MDAMVTSYEQRGYGDRPVGFGEKPGIVVVDFQVAFTDPAYPMGGAPMVRDAVGHTARLLKTARALGVPVPACYIAYSTEQEVLYWKVAGVRALLAGTPGTALDPAIHQPGYDMVVAKSAPSIFFNTPVAAFLTKQRVDTVIVTGCITSGCVRASIVDSFSHGFRTIVPVDCVGDQDIEAHNANLRDVDRRYCDLSTADKVIGWLDGWSTRGGNPAVAALRVANR
jgi:maleamate amidohydrolase